MITSYKTEINPTKKQKKKIEEDFILCRKVYNLYLTIALKQLSEYGEYGNYKDFLKWFYSFYLPDPKYGYQYPIKINYDAVRKISQNVDRSLRKYLNAEIRMPRLKDINRGHVSLFFSSLKHRTYTVICERHRIYVPEYGWLKIKEKGYLPTDNNEKRIISGSISSKAGKYYISINVDLKNNIVKDKKKKEFGEAIGIDLGVHRLAVLSDGRFYENVNYSEKIIRIKKHITRLHRSLRRKKCAMSVQGKSYKYGSNYNKNVLKLSKKYKQLDDIRSDYINKVIDDIISSFPVYIAIEDLHVLEMVKNRSFARIVSEQTFREFRTKLFKKCLYLGIELRIVNQWFPSSKICHNCGRIKKDLKHSDRVYRCVCGYVADRDYNASLNIRDAKDYYLAKREDVILEHF